MITLTREQQLDSMVNESFKYEKIIYKLKEWKRKQGRFILQCDRRTFVMLPPELDDLLENLKLVENFTEWKPKDLPETTNPDNDKNPESKTDLQIYEPTKNQKELQDSLMAMLELVKKDSKHIPQAKAVCDIANTMVAMEKNQIQLIRIAQQKKNRNF